MPRWARSSPGAPQGELDANRSAYALASADLFFTAGIAQYTIFFADIVGLSGSPPDAEIPSLTLLNGYTARLVAQNELNLREAWLRTELFGQRLALTAGRLDLTNYFDQNAFANDESTQFLSDALVNNQMLGLSSNGTGVAAEFDPKNGFRFKFGFQQSNDDATNLSDSMYHADARSGYTFTPFALPEGTYRVWFRTDNTPEDAIRHGLRRQPRPEADARSSACSRATARQSLDLGRDNFYSVGVGFQNGLIFNPQDTWGVGYAQMDLATGADGAADRGLLQLPSDGAAAALVPPHARARRRGYGVGVRLPAAGRAVPGGVLGETRSRSHVYIAAHSSHRRRAHRRRARGASPRPAGAGRQDHRSALGRHDREPRLERHRVHGHQDAAR